MARLNIEDCWWTDPRRSLLIKKIGEDKADIVTIRAWRLAQEFWKHGKGLVPDYMFQTLEHWQDLIDAKLADVRGSFVYVRGSSAYLDWVREAKENASKAGKASADARKKKHGSAQPISKKQEKTLKSSNDSRTESNDLEPSDSLSVSVSLSDLVSEVSTSTAAKKIASVPDLKFDAKSFDEVLNIIPETKKTLWLDLYSDEEFIIREIKKAFGWYCDNPQKKPKSTKGWLRALSSWLDRSWTYRSKNIPGKSNQIFKNEANHIWANTPTEPDGEVSA